jgi:hypothetical protein
VIDDKFTRQKTKPSINLTFHGITIDVSDEYQNADDTICSNREFDSNKSDENTIRPKKHDKERIAATRGIKID